MTETIWLNLRVIKAFHDRHLHDKVRCLTGPYPRAYIIAGDGSKLYIEKTLLSSD